MNRSSLNLILAGSLATALVALVAPASAQDTTKKKCFGVALKGQNDCAAGAHDCAGHAKVSYDKASFKLVPTGTCMTIKTPHGHGSLTPGRA
jgi:uncharacterized membrane protein